ncbi:unnamed protein product, partial [Mesorhabditis spiculigera]
MQCKQREELSKATLCREINDLLAHLFGNDNPAAYAAICGAQDHSSVYCSHFVEESVYNLYDDFNYGDISAVFLWPKLCMTIVGKWNRSNAFLHDFCMKWTGRCERRAHYCGQKDPKLLTAISFGFFFRMCKPHPTASERAYCLKEMLPSYISLFLDGGIDMFYTVGSAALNFVEEYVDGLPAEIFQPLFDSCRIDQLMQFDNRTYPLCRALHQSRNPHRPSCKDGDGCTGVAFPECYSASKRRDDGFDTAKCDFIIRTFVDVLGPQVYERLCIDANITDTVPIYCRILHQYIHLDTTDRYVPEIEDLRQAEAARQKVPEPRQIDECAGKSKHSCRVHFVAECSVSGERCRALSEKHFRRCIDATLAICDILWEKAPREFDSLLANFYSHECMGHSHIVASDRKYCSKIIAVCSRRNSKACRSVGRASAVKRSTGQRFTIYIIGFGPLALLLLGLFWCCPYAESWYLRRQYRKYEAELRLLNSKSRAVASESMTMSMATVMSASTSISVVKSRPRE